jgi:N-acetylglutamate synthase-like GNAT family acetyltransferase
MPWVKVIRGEIMVLQKIKESKKDYLHLLLLADPDVGAIERYLYKGDLYIYKDADTPVAAAVLYPLKDGQCELKNIAVLEELQGKGIGTEFLKLLMKLAAEKYQYMMVGTTSQTEGFYKSLGFEYSHTIPNFFIDNYPEPIFENGIQCIDMRCFQIKL